MAGTMNCVPIMGNLEIRVDRKGRGLYTLKDIENGAEILKEHPMISCQFPWNQDAGYKACNHCIRPLERAEDNARHLCQDSSIVLPLPDPSAQLDVRMCICGAIYCSQVCMENAANRYHRTLCLSPESPAGRAVDKLMKCWKGMHYPPEEASIMMLLRMYAYIHQQSNADEKLQAVQQFTSMESDASSDLFVDKLLGKFRDQVHSLWPLFDECIRILGLDIPAELKTEAGFLKLLSAMAYNSQGIGTCALSSWEQRIINTTNDSTLLDTLEDFMQAVTFKIEEAVGLEFMNNEGAGLYQIQSKVNHSCEPNAEVKFIDDNDILTLIALSNIDANSEITISYLDQCQLARSRHSRQKIIRSNHLFLCLCGKCEREAGDPDETSEDEDTNDDASM